MTTVGRPTVVLASASPARRRLLERSGITPVVRVSDVDEEGAIAAHEQAHGALTVAEQTLLLARLKAEAVRDLLDVPLPVVLIACDTTLDLAGEPHNKPAHAQEAIERWERMSGRRGLLHTGHALMLITDDAPRPPALMEVSTAVVEFGRPSHEEIQAYVSSGEPLRVAGAFTLEGLGGPFIDRIEGDPSGIEGLSLPTLRRMLLALGIRWTDLWDA